MEQNDRTPARLTACAICRNVAKIRDWIDLVFVKKRYYSKDVAYVPPVSRTQVGDLPHYLPM